MRKSVENMIFIVIFGLLLVGITWGITVRPIGEFSKLLEGIRFNPYTNAHEPVTVRVAGRLSQARFTFWWVYFDGQIVIGDETFYAQDMKLSVNGWNLIISPDAQKIRFWQKDFFSEFACHYEHVMVLSQLCTNFVLAPCTDVSQAAQRYQDTKHIYENTRLYGGGNWYEYYDELPSIPLPTLIPLPNGQKTKI